MAASSLLDRVTEENPGRVAHVEWHIYSTSPLYSAEANSKWRMYPPPYQGGYATPWLWVDGKNRSYSIGPWENYILDQMDVPSDVGLTHVGTNYDSASRNGEVQVEYYNSGSDTVRAAVQFAITEDSCHYRGSNGDSIHNAVLRDYVPNQNGTSVTLAPGGTDTLTLAYSLSPSWNQKMVKLVLYLQNMAVQPDSSMPCYQGIASRVLSFAGVQEPRLLSTGDLRVRVGPNPCRTICEFNLSGVAAHGARIGIYAPDGRLVSNVQTAGNRASWNRNGVARGVYMYRVISGTATAQGKLVVTD